MKSYFELLLSLFLLIASTTASAKSLSIYFTRDIASNPITTYLACHPEATSDMTFCLHPEVDVDVNRTEKFDGPDDYLDSYGVKRPDDHLVLELQCDSESPEFLLPCRVKQVARAAKSEPNCGSIKTLNWKRLMATRESMNTCFQR